jgi:hypothetical protein
MSTEKQIAANRQNAQRSTGPVTPEGKRRSSMNALRHGLCSHRPVLPGESPGDFNRFAKRIVRSLKPIDDLHKAIANQIASALWRLRRAAFIEDALLSSASQNVSSSAADPDAHWAAVWTGNDAAFSRFRRYQTSLERSCIALLREFDRYKAARKEDAADQDPIGNNKTLANVIARFYAEKTNLTDAVEMDDPPAQRAEPALQTSQYGSGEAAARPDAPRDDAAAPSPHQYSSPADPSPSIMSTVLKTSLDPGQPAASEDPRYPFAPSSNPSPDKELSPQEPSPAERLRSAIRRFRGSEGDPVF